MRTSFRSTDELKEEPCCSARPEPQNRLRITALNVPPREVHGVSEVRFVLSTHLAKEAQASGVRDFRGRNSALVSVGCLPLH